MPNTGIVNLTERIDLLTAPGKKTLYNRTTSADTSVRGITAEIVEQVQRGGDEALLQLARELDSVSLMSLEVPRVACRAALEGLEPELRKALERSLRNIESVQRSSLPLPHETWPEPGILIGRRPDPLD
ncbi:MAG: histidinol dehydrogenase, partial [Gemmatimonadaceae bacterium]